MGVALKNKKQKLGSTNLRHNDCHYYGLKHNIVKTKVSSDIYIPVLVYLLTNKLALFRAAHFMWYLFVALSIYTKIRSVFIIVLQSKVLKQECPNCSLASLHSVRLRLFRDILCSGCFVRITTFKGTVCRFWRLAT